MGFGERFARFVTTLKLDVELPEGFEVLDPYRDEEVRRVVREFCGRYYAGHHPRIGVWGINPGRFGAGVTGLSFTDPVSLRDQLGMATSIEGRRELSAEFIGMVIDAYGGPQRWYHDVFLSALSPLGFVRDGVNINFYDDRALERNIVPFVLDGQRAMIEAGVSKSGCVILGSGKLKSFVERYVQPMIGYDEVHYLDHPRFIMQYRRKQVTSYVERYVTTIRGIVEKTFLHERASAS